MAVEYGARTVGYIEQLFDVQTPVSVGKYCSIAGNVKALVGGHHNYRAVTTSSLWANGWVDAPRDKRAHGTVEIGNDVWIGEGAWFISPCRVGDGAVIGAQSVVRGDVPAYSIVIGNPATVIKYRFSPEQIDALLSIRWWDWPEERIKANARLLIGDIETFLRNKETA